MRAGRPWKWIRCARHVQPVVQMPVVRQQLLHLRDRCEKCPPDRPTAPPSGTARRRGRTSGGYRPARSRESRTRRPRPRPRAPSGGCCCRNRPSARPCDGTAASPRTCTAIDCVAAAPTALRIALARCFPFRNVQPAGQVAVHRVVRRGLVGHDVGPHAARRTSSGKTSAAFPSSPTETGRRSRHDASMIASASSRSAVRAVEIAGAQAHLDAAGLALDGQARGPRHDGRQRLRAAHAAQAGGQDPAPRQVAAVVLAPGLGERFVGALNDALRCRCRSTTRPSSGRTSSAPCDRARGNAPRSPSAAPGSNWRSARAAHRHGCGTRRPACRTAPAASRRAPAGAARRRCGRNCPSRAPRGRCRHTPPARPAVRRPRGPGCSSASAAAPRSASSSAESSVPRAA